MKTPLFVLNSALPNEAENPFSLFSDFQAKSKYATAEVKVRGYNGTMHLVADIIRTAILALECEGADIHPHAPEPNRHIAGVLAMALDLLPYEEADLLDDLHRQMKNATAMGQKAREADFRQRLEREGNYSATRILGKHHKKSPFLLVPLD